MEDWVLLLGGLILLLATLFALLVYSGVFANVDVKTGKPVIGRVRIAYKDGTGPYKNVGSIFTESTSIAPSLKQLGLYYDAPAKVPEENLRWAVGAILSENDEPVNEDIRAAYEKRNYKFMTLPEVPLCVHTQFPYSTVISILIAVKRVYPDLNRYIQQRGLEAYPFLEIYIDDVIHFMAPLSCQMEFYTPKAMESERKQAEEVVADPVEEVTDLTKPAVDPVASSDDPVRPVADPVTPAVDPVTPAVDPVTPAVDPVTPAVDPVTPAVDPVRPSDDPVSPAKDPTEQTEPADDPAKTTKDPTDQSKPATDQSKPADDQSKPATDQSKPANDPAKPADDPVKTGVDPAEPVVDPVQTLTSPVEEIVDVGKSTATSEKVTKQDSGESDSDGSFEKIDI